MKFHNITKCDMLNGDGLRVVLWVSGCEIHCKNCQNKITWDPDYGVEFTEESKKEIFDELDKDYISGITFSGGHPLHPNNITTIHNLIKEIKEKYKDKTIWLYTGYTYEYLKEKSKTDNILDYILKNVDVLVDGPYIDELRDTKLEWVGSSNQRVIRFNK